MGIHEDEDENRLTPLCCYLLLAPGWWQLLETSPGPCLEVFSVQFRPLKTFISDPCYQTQGLIMNNRHTQPLSYITFFLCMCVCIDVCACPYIGRCSCMSLCLRVCAGPRSASGVISLQPSTVCSELGSLTPGIRSSLVKETG